MHLTDPSAPADAPAGLARLGWEPHAPTLRETIPPITRGANLVVVAPPAPAWAAPALAALMSAPGDQPGGVLVLAPSPSLGEWAPMLAALREEGSGLPLLLAGAPKAPPRLAQVRTASPLITTPEVAVALLGVAAFDAGSVRAVLVGWPEIWEDPSLLDTVLQDVPREAQRVILTSDPAAVATAVQGHAWRAMTVGATSAGPVGPVTTLEVGWSQRIAILPELVAALEAEAVGIWTADATRHDEIRRTLAGAGIRVEVTTGVPEGVTHIIAFDPPRVERLGELCAGGQVTLLVSPGAERFASAIAAPRRPLLLPSDPVSAAGDTVRRRKEIRRVLEHTPLDPGLLALGPLFERHSPSAVAAALYELWRTGGPAPVPVAQTAPAQRVWVNAGRRDSIGPSDLVGLLINELQVDRASIGRIDLRETFALIEVPADEAERVAGALTGRTVRRRRLIARVDKTPSSPPRRGRQT